MRDSSLEELWANESVLFPGVVPPFLPAPPTKRPSPAVHVTYAQGSGGHDGNLWPLLTTSQAPATQEFDWDDATWVLISAFIIFTMQTGFGLLEAGCVSPKNEANIMMKNVVDVIFGGLTYWIFGYSMSFGTASGSNPFIGFGDYAVDAKWDDENMGPLLLAFYFQLSFATTATTIASGTMAERCNFKAYCVFSFVNTVVYAIPARWVWGPGGFLSELGCVDIAGSGAVHLLGGASGYAGAWMLGPRLGRYDKKEPPPLGNPNYCIVGMYMLWWGWLSFNSGSTYAVTGDAWKFAARAAAATIVASIGGGLAGSCWSFMKRGRVFEVMDVVNPILGALVAVTAGCALFHMWDALIVGVIGGIVTVATAGFADWTSVDDPVGATAVHAFAGIWGLVAVGLFGENDGDSGFSKGRAGLFRGGGLYLFGVQLLASLCITVWGFITTVLLLWVINKVIPIRMTPEEELLGADFVEHSIRQRGAGLTPALSALGSRPNVKEMKKNANLTGSNPGHESIVEALYDIGGGRSRKWKRLAIAVVQSTRVKAVEETKETIFQLSTY